MREDERTYRFSGKALKIREVPGKTELTLYRCENLPIWGVITALASLSSKVPHDPSELIKFMAIVDVITVWKRKNYKTGQVRGREWQTMSSFCLHNLMISSWIRLRREFLVEKLVPAWDGNERDESTRRDTWIEICQNVTSITWWLANFRMLWQERR